MTADYFEHHGIGAVVVVGPAQPAASESPLIKSIRQGIYDVYVVKAPTAIVTLDGVNATAISVGDNEIKATGTSNGGPIVIRRNWFPRWKATVNGKAVPVTETADGYMQINAPAGAVQIRLRYVVDRWDWLGRALAGLGTLLILWLSAPQRWIRPIARPARR